MLDDKNKAPKRVFFMHEQKSNCYDSVESLESNGTKDVIVVLCMVTLVLPIYLTVLYIWIMD